MLEPVGDARGDEGDDGDDGESEERLSKFELELDLAESGDAMVGSLGFNGDMYERRSVVRMAEHLSTVATALASSPDARLCDVSMMSADEASLVMEEWNETTQP